MVSSLIQFAREGLRADPNLDTIILASVLQVDDVAKENGLLLLHLHATKEKTLLLQTAVLAVVAS